MRQAQQGDQVAYATLLARLTPLARRYARGRVGDKPWIDDAVQDMLVTVHRARHTYDATRPFAPWFYAIASSRLIDVWRRERRIGGRELAGDILPEPAMVSPSTRDDIDVGAIRAALESLPSRQREVIERLKYRDESVRDVAGQLGMTESAVKITAHRGYKLLRRILRGSTRAD